MFGLMIMGAFLIAMLVGLIGGRDAGIVDFVGMVRGIAFAAMADRMFIIVGRAPA